MIYRENNRFRPASWPMEELGLFEGYTHMAGMLIHMQAVKEKGGKYAVWQKRQKMLRKYSAV